MLRFVESGETQPVGDATLRVAVRLIAAIHSDRGAEVARAGFRNNLVLPT